MSDQNDNQELLLFIVILLFGLFSLGYSRDAGDDDELEVVALS
ncbi:MULTISPECIES: hypothetical protein [Geomicrobium]|uniref:Uncharacterized protein n=1 Tax=Geomicrobium sediminis TaxID=1347788 RepID=A0ABS2P812_9BACL|nr:MULTISPECIES: hypothetical protein [Geomicrobium]MBM7631496.1 hypothetical protein [Geomicrobium sediminis]